MRRAIVTHSKFHWGGAATDDYYSLQDRLQKMYSEGMNEFLGEQVTYIDEQQISYAFTHYLGKLDATKDAVLQYFRQQKFYTNNDLPSSMSIMRRSSDRMLRS